MSGREFGDFTLLEDLGRSAVADRYKAMHAVQGGPFFLKAFTRLDASLHAELNERGDRLIGHHGNLAPHLGHGTVGDVPFTVSPWLEGIDLVELSASLRDRRVNLTLDHCLIILVELSRSVGALHQLLKSTGTEGAHGDVSIGHVRLGPDGQIWLTGLCTPRGLDPKRLPEARFDLAGVAALLYDLVPLLRGGAARPPLPTPLDRVIRRGLGIGPVAEHLGPAEFADRLNEVGAALKLNLDRQAFVDVVRRTIRAVEKKLLESGGRAQIGAKPADAIPELVPVTLGPRAASQPPTPAAVPTLEPLKPYKPLPDVVSLSPPPVLPPLPPVVVTPPVLASLPAPLAAPARPLLAIPPTPPSLPRPFPPATPLSAPRPATMAMLPLSAVAAALETTTTTSPPPAAPASPPLPPLPRPLPPLPPVLPLEPNASLRSPSRPFGRLEAVPDLRGLDQALKVSHDQRGTRSLFSDADEGPAAGRPQALPPLPPLAPAPPATLPPDAPRFLSNDTDPDAVRPAKIEAQKALPGVQALLSAGVITGAQLERAAIEQTQRGGRTLEILVAHGVAHDDDVARALSQAGGRPLIAGADVVVTDLALLRRIPQTYALARRLLPLALDNGVLLLAVADPFEHKIIDEVKGLLHATSVDVRVAGRRALTEATVAVFAKLNGTVAASGPRVLLCVHDQNKAGKLGDRLAQEGMQVEHVVDGHTAKQLLGRAQGLPQAVICSHDLPGLDGRALLLHVRNHETTAELPFFVLGPRSDDDLIARVLDLGADDFFAEPLRLDVVLAKLRRAIDKGKRHESSVPTRPTAPPAPPRSAPPPSGGDFDFGELPDLPPEFNNEPPADAGPLPTGVMGTLRQMALAEIVQSLEMGRKTASVDIVPQDGEKGMIGFQGGAVRYAACGALVGEPAFFALMRHKEGFFRIHYGDAPPTTNIDAPTTFLLLEAMRLMDEEGMA